MKIQLRLERRLVNGYLTTVLTHIKVLGDDGRYLAFAQHTDELVAHLGTVQFDVPADLLTWKGKSA